jgi:hypothetical protein
MVVKMAREAQLSVGLVEEGLGTPRCAAYSGGKTRSVTTAVVSTASTVDRHTAARTRPSERVSLHQFNV